MGDSDTDDTAAEAVFAAWQRHRQPRNEIPATVPLDAAIGTSHGLVVFITSLSVYSNGIAFTTEARARGGPGSEDRPVWLVDGLTGTVPPHDRMLLGVEFADGRRCLATPRGQEANPADEPLVLTSGSEGGSGDASAHWFLSPFPPPGDLRFHCAWPAAGIPETTTVVPADRLHDAAGRVQQLWPQSRLTDQQPDPAPVALPPDGWFIGSGLPTGL